MGQTQSGPDQNLDPGSLGASGPPGSVHGASPRLPTTAGTPEPSHPRTGSTIQPPHYQHVATQSLEAMRALTRQADGQDTPVVVYSNAPMESRDAAMEIINQLPRFLPLIPSSLDHSRVYADCEDLVASNPDIAPMDQEAAYQLCLRLQMHFTSEAKGAAHNQRLLEHTVARTQYLSEQCADSLAGTDYYFGRMMMELQEVEGLAQALADTREHAFRITEAINRVNTALPPSLRLPEFPWTVRPQPSTSAPSNPTHTSDPPSDNEERSETEREMVVFGGGRTYAPVTNPYAAAEEDLCAMHQDDE